MISFAQFIEMFAAETGNHHAIINREGRIIVVGPRGQFQYDTIADFARAHAQAPAPASPTLHSPLSTLNSNNPS